jgi:hypothetical protein
MRRSTFAAALTAAVALVAAVAANAATPSPSYQVTGVELGLAQGTTSTFTGFATGSQGDRGFWRASVSHAPFSTCSTVGSSCAVTGGTLGLTSSNRSQVTGTFADGSFTLTASAPGCGRQQYAVTADAGSAQLAGTLTTLRVSFRGTCLVLTSTLTGTLSTITMAPPA